MVGEGGGRKRSRESLGLDNGANGGRSLLSVGGTGALTPDIYLQHRERQGGGAGPDISEPGFGWACLGGVWNGDYSGISEVSYS